MVNTKVTHLVLHKTLFGHLPFELITVIHSFVAWDRRSMSFAVHISQKQPRKYLNSWILTTMNRQNGFRGQEEPDTEHEHWALGDFENCLQAINCKTCGNYKVASFVLSPSIHCQC